MNWECAILCEKLTENPSKSGIWIDLPPGHHEFRFIKNGRWTTDPDYGHTCNEFGDANNWIKIE